MTRRSEREPLSDVIDRIAAAINGAAERNAKTTAPEYAKVISPPPNISAELHNGELLLTSDDLSMGQWPTEYHGWAGIQSGDTLIVQQLADDEWVVTDVLTGRNPELPFP